MTNMMIRKKLLMVLVVMVLPFISTARDASVNYRAKKIEMKADRAFIRGDYDKAMRLFTQADSKLKEDDSREQKLNLELKIARLYILLQNPAEAIRFYHGVQRTAGTKLTVDDVCFYVDALRQQGESQRAEIVARQYAFLNPYSRNQRYLNTLYSLSDLQKYYGRGDSDYAVELLEKNSAIPEYWLGEWNGKAFYAVSHSRIQDPLKVFYHQTQYFSLANNAVEPFRDIPRELQSGPMAFSENKKMMVATGISYRNSDRIKEVGTYGGMFVTQLYYSLLDERSGGWRRFESLFEHQEGFNYAHPAFFNNGKSLVFSSDCPGGYGGMDLYISHWDDPAGKWGEPINMGPVVNTEGDEIYPRIVGDGLYFASNGLEGFGGYDIYRVSFGRNLVLPGSLYHYPYPINTAYNDFGVFFHDKKGYFISDRSGLTRKDDIYVFDATISPLSSRSAVGVSDEYSAMAGNLNMITGLKTTNTQTFEKELIITPTYVVPAENEVVLSLYFDFNHYDLDAEAVGALRLLLTNPALDDVQELYVLGYADEFGSLQYNKHLSEQRAQSVAHYMENAGVNIPRLFVEGKGKLALSQEEYIQAIKEAQPKYIKLPANGEVNTFPGTLPFVERVKMNRKLRRVDIIVKKK